MKKVFFVFALMLICFSNSAFSQSAGCAQDSVYRYHNGEKVKYTDDEKLNGIQLDCQRQKDTIVVSVFAWGDTDAGYVCESIDFDNTLNYQLSNEIILPKDDCWGKKFDLSFNNPTPPGIPPFAFHFYDQEYVSVVPNSNGSLRFLRVPSDWNDCVTPDNASPTDPSAWKYCSYATSQTLPDTRSSWGSNGSPVLNAVMTPFHDIHFGTSASSNGCSTYPGHMYFEIQGEYPCRKILLSYYQVPLFGGSSHCTEQGIATHMAVLYETTNVIEFYIKDSPLQSSTNAGKSVLGIQNYDGQFVCPPGRNDGLWEAHNEAWRIRPTGALEYDVQWFKRTTKGPHAGELQQITSEVSGLPSGLRAIVAEPTIEDSTTTYIARAEIWRLDDNSFYVYDSITYHPFQVEPMKVVGAFDSIVTVINKVDTVLFYDTVCKGDSITFTFSGANRYAILEPENLANIPVVVDSAMVNDTMVYTGRVTVRNNPTLEDVRYVFRYIDLGYTYDTVCSRTLTAMIHNKEFNVDLGNDTTICRNETAVYNDLLKETPGVYTWSNGYVGEQTSYEPQETEWLRCTLTDRFGCSATDSARITVNVAPDVTIEGIMSICQGTSTTLRAVSSEPNCIYEWSNGATTESITVSPNSTTEYTVKVKLPPAMCEVIETATVEVKQSPDIYVSEDKKICNGESAEINVYDNESYTPRYVWHSLDESVEGSGEQHLIVSPFSTTQYVVNAYNDINCSSTDTLTVFVEQKPRPVITLNPKVIDALTPIVVFVDSTENSATTLWEISDGSISEDRVFMHEFEVGDTNLSYTVRLTSSTSFGCVDSTSMVVRVKREHYLWAPTGVYLHATDPANRTFSIHVDNVVEYNLRIYNRWGTLVYETNDMQKAWDCTYKGKPVQQGVYVWKATFRHNDSPNRLQKDSGEFMIYE